MLIARKRVILVSFSTNSRKFKSLSERNKFFRDLYGWKQIVKKSDKRYCYERDGLLDEFPHIKVDDSVFITAERNLSEVEEYFNRWREKVAFRIMKFLLDEKKMLEQLKPKKEVNVKIE